MKNQFAILLVFCSVALFGCSRQLSPTSRIVVQTPPAQNNSAKSTVDCFAVNVTGEGIPPLQNACSPLIGQHSDFVPAGAAIDFEVNSGSARNIQLYVHKVPAGQACPTWNDSFDSPANAKGNFSKTFKADSEIIDLVPGIVQVTLENNPASTPLISEGLSCSEKSVKAKLYSNGDIENASDQPFVPDFSHPTNLGITKHDEDQLSGETLSFATGGLFADLEGLSIQLPPHLHGVSQKPDTKEFFGLQADGKVVKIDTAAGALEDLSGSCPFDSCQVPVWMESFSVGFGTSIFGKDHSGQIWEITGPNQVSPTGDSVPPNVSQVVYF